MKPLNGQQPDEQLNKFTKDAQKLFGTDDESIRDEWEAAELAWEQEKRDHPEEARKIQMSADAGFEALMQRIQREQAEQNFQSAQNHLYDEEDGVNGLEDENLEPEDDDTESDNGNTGFEDDSFEQKYERPGIRNENSGPESAVIFGHSDDGASLKQNVVPMTGTTRKGRLRGRKKALLLVAVVGVMMFGMTMASTATSKYGMNKYLLPDSQSKVMNRNANLSVVVDGSLKEAYNEIEKNLGIPVLVLKNTPKELQFKRLFLEEEHAIIEFSYNDKSVYFEEAKMPKTKGLSTTIVSDRKMCEEVYNFWLDKTIPIEANVLENGLTEYSAQIELENSYYYLSGIMERNSFVELVEEICNY